MLLAAIALVLLVPLTILGVSYTRWARPGMLWFFAIISALTVWALVLLAWFHLPVEITIPASEYGHLSNASLSLLLDKISWPFAAATIALPLAAILTDIAYLRDLDARVWASTLALGGAGLIAVLAGTPVTLLLAWTVINVSDVFVLLQHVEDDASRERVVAAFSARIMGMFFLMLAMLQAQATGDVINFTAIPAQSTGYLLVAAGLQLGVFPPHQPHLGAPGQRRSLGTVIRLLPSIVSLAFVARIAASESSPGTHIPWETSLLVLTVLTALYGAWLWYQADSALQGRSYWVLSLAAFALASAMQGLAAASMAWGLAAIFSGGLLFLFGAENRRWMLVFPALGAAGFSMLPLTPAWDGSMLFGALAWGYTFVFTVALALLFAGYLRHTRTATAETELSERWMWLIYPLGLGVLPLTHFGVVYLYWVQGTRGATFQTAGWWFGVIPLGLAALLLVWNNRKDTSAFPVRGAEYLTSVRQSFNLNFIYRFFWNIYRLVGRFVDLLSRLIEGDGGILWALLLLIFTLVSLGALLAGGTLDL